MLTSARFILQQYYSVTWTQFNVRNQIPTSVCALHISGHKRILHRWRFINYLAALQSITAKRRWRSDEETVVHSTAVHKKLTAIEKSTKIFNTKLDVNNMDVMMMIWTILLMKSWLKMKWTILLMKECVWTIAGTAISLYFIGSKKNRLDEK